MLAAEHPPVDGPSCRQHGADKRRACGTGAKGIQCGFCLGTDIVSGAIHRDVDKVLRLVLVSVSSLLNSISRPGRMKAYSPQRRIVNTTAKTGNTLNVDSRIKPNTMAIGSSVSSALTPRRVAMRPVRNSCVTTVSD